VLPYDFENSVAYWIFATAHDLARAMNTELAGCGITSRQWEVLVWLSHEGDISQTELAEKMGIEAPTLVGVLDRMERDGWIHRLQSETDRRKNLIRPTEQVRPVWEQMVACAQRIRTRATAEMTPDQVQQLGELLRLMRIGLTGADGCAAPRPVTETTAPEE
jgi:MarR family transcriptional regulator for hemolysin